MMRKIIYLRNIARAIGLTAALAIALGSGAGFAKASVNVGGGNGTTGPNSENENTWSIKSKVDVDISNHSSADNSQCFEVATGDFSVKNNTKTEDVSTGDIWGSIDVSNVLNNGDIALMSMDPGNVSITLANGTTGPNSENENKVSVETNRDVDISNNADIDNMLRLALGTGDNSINHNTVVGDISTGDIEFDATVDNTANHSAGDIDLSGMGGVNVTGTLTNSITGPSSENENNVNVSSNSDIDIHNTASIDNTTNVSANTGDNTIGHNTVVGDISTGSISIEVSTTNAAN